MVSTGISLEDAFRLNARLLSTSFGTSSNSFRDNASDAPVACDIFVWSRDIKRGTHISVDQQKTPVFPPPMDHGTVRFFVCDNESGELRAIFATSSTYLRDLKPKLGQFYMIPIRQLNDLLSEGMQLAEDIPSGGNDAMDVDEPSLPEDDTPTSSDSARVAIKWISTHPFTLEASRIERVMTNILGDDYTEQIGGPLKAYLQLLREAIVHLAAPTDRYRDNMSNFFLLYTCQYGFWTSEGRPRVFPPMFYDLQKIPTMEETRTYLLKRAGYLFDEPACKLICIAEEALCGFQSILALRSQDIDAGEIIVAAISEFSDFTASLQHELGTFALPGREWWREITVDGCIISQKRGTPLYRLPFELALLLNPGSDTKRWPGLMCDIAPAQVELSDGYSSVDQETMLLYVLPIIRRLIVEDTLQINRALYYRRMGGRDFPGARHLGNPTRLDEARARQSALDDARFAEQRLHIGDLPGNFVDESLAMKEDFDESLLDGTSAFFPRIDQREYQLFDQFERSHDWFTHRLPKKPVSRWIFNDASHASPTLRQFGFSALWFDRKLAAELIRQTSQTNTNTQSMYDEWLTGKVAEMVPDIEDFASDGSKRGLLPPCLRSLAKLTPPKKKKGPTRLKNGHRLGAASTFLRIGYDPEQVISYMSDGTSSRTSEAAGVVRSHVTTFFNGGDFVTANRAKMPYHCYKLVENAHESPATTLHCPYAAGDRTVDIDQAVAKCSCDNLPNYAATQKPMARRHPIFLLLKRLQFEAAQTPQKKSG